MLARFVVCIIQAIMHASCGLGLSTVHNLFGIHKVASSSTCPKYNRHAFGIGLLCLISSKKSSDQMYVGGGGCIPLSCSFFLQSSYFSGHWNRNIVCQEVPIVPQPVSDGGF